MKRRTIFLLILMASMLPLTMSAQDDMIETIKECRQLEGRIHELDSMIRQERVTLSILRSDWYNTCTEYLKKNQFDSGELDYLISHTVPEVDGDRLYEELKKAQKCFEKQQVYTYTTVPRPADYVDPNDEALPLPSDNREDDPAVGDDTREPLVDPDPVADGNGDDKAAPIDKKYPDKGKADVTPVTNPVSTGPKTGEASKSEKKPDRGEMEYGKSKASKRNDGQKK